MKKLSLDMANDSDYKSLVKSRNATGWTLTLLIMIAYYGFIYLVAFEKDFMSQSAFGGVTSVSVLGGIFVIAITILTTGIYVAKANRKFDVMTKKLKQEYSH